MVLLVCLTFVGQALASTVMSYDMMCMPGMSGQEQLQDMPMMDHSSHNMLSETADNVETSAQDCCTKTCQCFTGGCSSVAVFMKTAGNVAVAELSSKQIPWYSRLAQSPQPTSLYRPPILS